MDQPPGWALGPASKNLARPSHLQASDYSLVDADPRRHNTFADAMTVTAAISLFPQPASPSGQHKPHRKACPPGSPPGALREERNLLLPLWHTLLSVFHPPR